MIFNHYRDHQLFFTIRIMKKFEVGIITPEGPYGKDAVRIAAMQVEQRTGCILTLGKGRCTVMPSCSMSEDARRAVELEMEGTGCFDTSLEVETGV